ncbi:MAG: type I DNA topoisomerase [Proteobacteria bacterium]|jgi:DNA topoisomerase I|nr:type I DNA topoisomerase [Pseudomonadota bacterium]
MGKTLVIVESPAKAKTINQYLGNEYVVRSSVGHVRDLPVSGSRKKVDPKKRAEQAARTRKMSPAKKARYRKEKARRNLVQNMGINPDKGWEANYQILPDKVKVVNELQKLAAKSDAIYLATDLDREGEAIAWHLKEVIGADPQQYHRVVFNEITKQAVQEAFAHPGKLDEDKVQAQQARRFLDRVVGFMLSPLLWAKIARGLSAGRVQSVAVSLLVEREREIRAFVPEEYWEIYADTHCAQGALRLEVVKQSGKTFRPVNQTEAEEAVALLQAHEFQVSDRSDKKTQSRPNPPLITSTLQQAASTRLGFSVKKTMTLAQRLYEAGFITYMRTDSTHLSADALSTARTLIGQEYGEEYLPPSPNFYASKADAQEAHEAIRPTDVHRLGRHLALERDQERLYDLIRNYFLASQMTNARFLSSTITVCCGDFELRTRGRILQFDGYTRALPPAGKQEDKVLPDIDKGQELTLESLEPIQNFTKPVGRFTEASLVKELEKRGIGRPSTYASIISTIQDRGYAKVVNRRFFAQKVGEIVTDRLCENFKDLMDYGFTAGMEETLDEVAAGRKNWKDVLDEFYSDFCVQLEAAQGEGEGKSAVGGMRANIPTDTDIACPQCGRHMQVRTGATGVFLGCSGYGLSPKERCTQTLNLIMGDETEDVAADDDDEARRLVDVRRCGICRSAMEPYLIDEKRKLHICGNNPDCTGFEVEPGEFKLKGYDGPTLECDKCGAEMQLKTGRFGKYFGCTAEVCKNTRKLLRSGEPAPPKADPIPMPDLRCEKVDDFYLLRDGASGIFLAASQFPRNRETRAPLVREVASVADQLDPKHRYLATAPTEDSSGHPVQIRYSRKTREQYVMTESDGKATGWKAFYRNGAWETMEKAVTVRKTIRKKTKAAKKKSAAKRAGMPSTTA